MIPHFANTIQAIIDTEDMKTFRYQPDESIYNATKEIYLNYNYCPGPVKSTNKKHHTMIIGESLEISYNTENFTDIRLTDGVNYEKIYGITGAIMIIITCLFIIKKV